MTITTATVLSICLLILTAMQDVRGSLYCMQCADVANARDCHVVKQCGPDQVCYSTTVVSTTGRISRKLGCRDRVQCSSAMVGRRTPFRSAGDMSICDECCDTTLCQTKLCHDIDYNADKGPICFKCDLREQNAPCLHTTECGRDEVCFKSYKRTQSGNNRVQTGCFVKTFCASISTATNFQRTNATCFNCCGTDLCNTDCGPQSSSSTGGPIATQTSALKLAAIFALLFLTLCFVQSIQGDTYCLECSEVPSARDCGTIKKCGPHEVCYSSQVVSITGHIYRRMGCRDRMQCSGAIVGKRSDVRDKGDIIVCDGCCDTTLCQPKLCQDQDYLADRGPICFRCQDQLPTEACTHITECARDEVCLSSSKRSPSGTILLQANCFGKQVCARISAATNFQRTNETCFKCCGTDLCNTDCGPHSALSTAGPIATQTSAPHCVDATPQATCKLASSIVCQDKVHAHNAKCMHYCGFC